jgi:hypothetical protein
MIVTKEQLVSSQKIAERLIGEAFTIGVLRTLFGEQWFREAIAAMETVDHAQNIIELAASFLVDKKKDNS